MLFIASDTVSANCINCNRHRGKIDVPRSVGPLAKTRIVSSLPHRSRRSLRHCAQVIEAAGFVSWSTRRTVPSRSICGGKVGSTSERIHQRGRLDLAMREMRAGVSGATEPVRRAITRRWLESGNSRLCDGTSSGCWVCRMQHKVRMAIRNVCSPSTASSTDSASMDQIQSSFAKVPSCRLVKHAA